MPHGICNIVSDQRSCISVAISKWSNGFEVLNGGVSLPWKITRARRTRVAINQLRGWRLEEVVAVTGRWRPAAASYCILYGVVLWFCGARGRSRASRTGRCNLAAIVIFGTITTTRSRESCFVVRAHIAIHTYTMCYARTYRSRLFF